MTTINVEVPPEFSQEEKAELVHMIQEYLDDHTQEKERDPVADYNRAMKVIN